jgi:parallel beta-helix repeat protein
MVNVKDFGAIGDGRADASVPLRRAAAAAAGDDLYFPPGVYVASDIALPANVHVHGNATLKLRALPSGNYAPFFRLTRPRVTIEGLTFDGNRVRQYPNGFSDSFDTGFSGTGKANRAAILGDNYRTGFSIRDLIVRGCRFVDGWGSSIALRDVSGVWIDGNIFDDSNFESVFAYTSGGVNTGLRITNNLCRNIGSGDATVNANAFVASLYDGLVVSGNQVYTCERNLIKAEACNDAVVSGNSLHTNTRPNFSGIQCQAGGSRIIIANNVLRNVQAGIALNGNAAFEDVAIQGNVIDGGHSIAGTPDGITISGGDQKRISIVGNTITNVNRDGIYIVNCSQLLITGNTITPDRPQNAAGVGIHANYTADGADVVISANSIARGFKQASIGGSGALWVDGPGKIVSDLSIVGNRVATETGGATERSIVAQNGIFPNLQIANNLNDGLTLT